MRFHLIAVGRLRLPGLREACELYVERIRRYGRIHVREVREAGRRGPDGAAARRLEGERLRAAVPDGARVVALARSGMTMDSEAFARRVGRWREEGRDVAFLLGGAYGLWDRAVEDADLVLSLGAMTLPHDVARLVLLEQLYRAFTMLRGEPYHKGGGGA